VEAYVKLLDG